MLMNAMGAPGMGVDLEEGEQRLVSRFGARGLAHMHGATISALHGDGDPVLSGQRLTPCAPAVVDAMALELQAQRMHKVIRQHADEQMPFDTSINWVEHLAQGQVGFERSEHRLQLGEHDPKNRS